MFIDPTTDPWGACLLGAGIVSTLALLVCIGAQLGGRRAGWMGWLLGLSLLGFLGSAAMGALANINGAPADVAAPAVAQAGGTAATDARGTPLADSQARVLADGPSPSDLDSAVPEDGDSPLAQPEARAEVLGDAQDGVGPPVEARPVEPTSNDASVSGVQPLSPLPDDPKDLRTEARLVLREGKRVASSTKQCKELKALGKAWAALVRLPTDVYRDRVEVITRRLDACRRKATWGRAYAVHRQRVDTRNTFRDTIRKRLAAQDIRVSTAVSGLDHERLRVGGRNITKSVVDGLLADGLADELAGIGFAKVSFANGTESWTEELEPVTDKQRVTEELKAHGLDKPLALSPVD